MKKITAKDIKFGMIVFIDSRSKFSIMSRAVRMLQNNGIHPDSFFIPNHCGIIVEENEDINKIKMAHASLRGLVIEPIKPWIISKTTNILVKKYKKRFTPTKKRHMIVWVEKRLGMDYDYLSFLPMIGLYFVAKAIKNPILRRILRKLPNPLDSEKRLICSELIWRVWMSIWRVLVWTGINTGYISPRDIMKSKYFKVVGRYFNYTYPKKRKNGGK
ncbi:unnamed protein product [marine sediment metagenome]|uniref:Uncharacterized protein n=1 Tax=marine sediment metagenome TaxID=412755 RepID=X1T7K0_9ZZZZ